MKKKIGLVLILLTLSLAAMNLSWLRALYFTLVNHNHPAAFKPFPSSYIADDSIYEFNSSTILSELSSQKADVFNVLPGPPPEDTYLSAPTGTPSGTYPWKQADYMMVVAAIHVHAWREPLERWYLNQITFGVSECRNNISGFDFARLTYYKKGITTFTVEGMDIYPLYQEAFWGDSIYERFGDWTSIDLTGMKVTADDALRIAEEHGGMSTRQSKSNDCYIIVSPRYNASKDNWRWKVMYYGISDPLKMFEIYVDAYTGEFEIGSD